MPHPRGHLNPVLRFLCAGANVQRARCVRPPAGRAPQRRRHTRLRVSGTDRSSRMLFRYRSMQSWWYIIPKPPHDGKEQLSRFLRAGCNVPPQGHVRVSVRVHARPVDPRREPRPSHLMLAPRQRDTPGRRTAPGQPRKARRTGHKACRRRCRQRQRTCRPRPPYACRSNSGGCHNGGCRAGAAADIANSLQRGATLLCATLYSIMYVAHARSSVVLVEVSFCRRLTRKHAVSEHDCSRLAASCVELAHVTRSLVRGNGHLSRVWSVQSVNKVRRALRSCGKDTEPHRYRLGVAELTSASHVRADSGTPTLRPRLPRARSRPMVTSAADSQHGGEGTRHATPAKPRRKQRGHEPSRPGSSSRFAPSRGGSDGDSGGDDIVSRFLNSTPLIPPDPPGVWPFARGPPRAARWCGLTQARAP